ncbi:MAG: FkbM family methyltransferase [Planctomycetota bacterium]
MGLRKQLGWHLWRRKVRSRQGVCVLHGVRLQTNHPLVTDDVAYAVYRREYEYAELGVIAGRVRPDDVILELGCGMGFIGIVCALQLERPRIVGVEANPDLIPLLHENYELNGVEAELIHAAASDTPGDVAIDVSGDFRYSAVGAAPAPQSVSVLGVSLASLLAEHRPTFLMLDIEGVETRVLTPDVDLSTVRAIVVEVHANLTGNATITRMLAALFAQGFILDLEVSSPPVLLLRRED